MKEHQKEFDWEVVPYTHVDLEYCLWMERHSKVGEFLLLSNTMDACEAIQLVSKSQVGELIERLKEASKFLKD